MKNKKQAMQVLDGLAHMDRNGLLLFLSEILIQRPSAIINASVALEIRGADLGFTKERDLVERLSELIKQNKFIDAIKLHRQETGLGLRESKYFCDELRQTINNERR